MNQPNKIELKLANTLKKMCKKKSLNKISVTALSKACDINRSTFYYHFLDIEDLIVWIFHNDIIDQCFKITLIDWQSSVKYLFEEIRENRTFYKQAMFMSSGNSLRKEIHRVFYKLFIDYINSYLGEKTLSEVRIDFIAQFYASASTHIAIEYVKSEAVESPREMTNHFFDVLWPGLINAVDNMVKRESQEQQFNIAE